MFDYNHKCPIALLFVNNHLSLHLTQSNGKVAEEYTGYISVEGYDSLSECPGYDTKQCDGEIPEMMELWEMQSAPSLPLLRDPLWLGVVAPDRGHFYGANRTKLDTYAELNCLK